MRIPLPACEGGILIVLHGALGHETPEYGVEEWAQGTIDCGKEFAGEGGAELKDGV